MKPSVTTLDSKVKEFTNSLPYWAKFLSSKLLSGIIVTDFDLATAFDYLREDIGLKERTEKNAFNFLSLSDKSDTYKSDLRISNLQNAEGINALVEKQRIEFSPNITVIYGINGSGKTGYIRLLKKAFFSRTDENIVSDIHNKYVNKKPTAEFVFESNNNTYMLKYPDDIRKPEFKQFSVFDNKSVLVHLDKPNEFEFRPAGLSFFANLSDNYKKVEKKLDSEINIKNVAKDYLSIFDGESEINKLMQNISAKTKIDNLKKHIPYTENDKLQKKNLEEKIAKLTALKVEKEIQELENIQQLVDKLLKNINKNNRFFSKEAYDKIEHAINGCLDKEIISKNEGIESFKTAKLKDIGSTEWKNLIEAAYDFVQKHRSGMYPKQGEICLFCHQPLSEEAQKLISKYWIFIKSQAEAEMKAAQEKLKTIEEAYKKIDFNILPVDGILTKWVKEKYLQIFDIINGNVAKQKELTVTICKDISTKDVSKWDEVQINPSVFDVMNQNIQNEIKNLKEKDPTEEIEKLKIELRYLEHKEKLEQHIDSINEYINNLQTVEKLQSAKRMISTRSITTKEKELSQKYFNQAYIDTFNDECKRLDANFGIEIKYIGKAGTSLRALKIKGQIPSNILSEGEQKVISIADFLAETQHSEINKGIILDDPVNSLDEERKSIIAKRLVSESEKRQVIIFTHDLVFLSSILGFCKDLKVEPTCHWIERENGKPGKIWLNNTPSAEKDYKTSDRAHKYYNKASKCGPEDRENNLKNGFTALRTSYEALVMFELFNGVVERFNERVSIDRLSSVSFDTSIRDEILDKYGHCCRFMEGHCHSDKYAARKPELKDLQDEINIFDDLRKRIRRLKNK